MKQFRVNKIALLSVVLFISVLFLAMIRQYLLAIFLAGIFSAMAQPLYRRLKNLFKGRENLASFTTLLIIFLVFLLPLAVLAGIITAQAIKVGSSVTPWIQQNLRPGGETSSLLQNLPFYEAIQPYRETIIQKAGEGVSGVSNWLANSLSDATLSTVNFMFVFFIFIYIMFFFIKDGKKLLDKILYYLPLEDRDERRMLEKFTSVTRAAIKGSLVIGILQGALAGVAFWAVGIKGAAFWGTIMAVLSIIPLIGSGLIWVPAAIILAVSGAYVEAAGLTIFCALIVGSMDNFLRPRLVGRDTRMHDLFILLSTLGGISMFGVMGFIIGPITAALFVTAWDIYGETFRDFLPKVSEEDDDS
ncbi:MAG: AI-2E family transporter [Spirochaetota bacterium]